MRESYEARRGVKRVESVAESGAKEESKKRKKRRRKTKESVTLEFRAKCVVCLLLNNEKEFESDNWRID